MRKLFFEVTLFDYHIDGEIVPFVINQRTYFRNAAKTNRLGVEAGLKCEPLEGIELTTNYTFTRFRYDDYTSIEFTPSGTTTARYTGNTVPSVPHHILNFIFNYEFEISDRLDGLLQWDCDYISSMYLNDSNSARSPGYFYGNSMAGVNATFEPFNVVFYVGVNNIFDRRYVGFVNINDFYGRYYEAGEPRNIYGGLNLSFRY